MIVKKVETVLNIGGTVFPVGNFTLQLKRGNLPQLRVAIPMGQKMAAKGMTDKIDVSKIKEGDSVFFSVKIGGTKDLATFVGIIRSTSLEVKLSTTGKSSASFSVQAEHLLSCLGGLPVLSRAIVGEGKQSFVVIDTYRTDVVKGLTGTNSAIGSMLTDKTAPDGLIGLLRGNPMPAFIIDLLITLYKTEEKAAGPKETGRKLDKAAVRVLEDLKKQVVGGRIKKKVSGKTKGRSEFVHKQVENIRKIWGGSNGLDILRKMLNDVFFCLTPKLNGIVAVRQHCPVYATEDVHIKNTDILGVNESYMFDATPITGIRMRKPKLANDFYSSTNSTSYIQYPDPSEEKAGLYKYVDSSVYAPWFIFASDYTPRKDGSKGADIPSTANTPNQPPKTDKKNDGAMPPYAARQNELYLEVGKAAYGLQKWANNSIVLKVAYVDNIQIGDIVKMDLTGSKALAAGIPTGTYFGYADGIVIAGGEGSAAMSISLVSVRTEQDNKKYGLQEYPMYEKPK